MRSMLRAAGALAVLGLMAGAANRSEAGQIIFSDFGAGDSFAMNGRAVGSVGTSNFVQSFRFATQAGADLYLETIDLAVDFAQAGTTLDMQLRENSGVTPGALLETLSFTDSSSSSVESATSSLNPLLTGGTFYWLTFSVREADKSAGIYNNTTGLTGRFETTNNGSLVGSGTTTTLTFRLNGTTTPPALAAVPEPSTLVSAATAALAGLGAWWRKRRMMMRLAA